MYRRVRVSQVHKLLFTKLLRQAGDSGIFFLVSFSFRRMRHMTIQQLSFSSKYQYCVLCLVQLTCDSAVIPSIL
jgi:hypothetical protein